MDPPRGSTVVVVPGEGETPVVAARTRDIAARLGLDLVDVDEATAMAANPGVLRLRVSATGLELLDHNSPPSHPLRIDFTAMRLDQPANRSRRQAIVRAAGERSVHIVDATAGLGMDAARLAAAGFKVTAIERNAALAAMLDDALDRATQDEATRQALGGRLGIVHADARDWLANRSWGADEPPPDAIIMDPMYPPRKRESALSRRPLVMLRALVGDDVDASELLNAARSASRRVAVKRPAHAPPVEEDPDAVIQSKLVRFDLYMRP